jgi:hypothetical protein
LLDTLDELDKRPLCAEISIVWVSPSTVAVLGLVADVVSLAASLISGAADPAAMLSLLHPGSVLAAPWLSAPVDAGHGEQRYPAG